MSNDFFEGLREALVEGLIQLQSNGRLTTEQVHNVLRQHSDPDRQLESGTALIRDLLKEIVRLRETYER